MAPPAAVTREIKPTEKSYWQVEGNVTRQVREIIENEVLTADLLAEISNQQPISSGPLPHDCVWFERTGVSLTYVVQLPPQIFNMKYRRFYDGDSGFNPTDFSKNVLDLKLSWPSSLWFGRFSRNALIGSYLVFTPDLVREKEQDTVLWCTLLPNIHGGGNDNICLGNDFVMPEKMPVYQRMEKVISHMYASVWNRDLQPSLSRSNYGIANYEEWAKLSDTPDGWKKIKFPMHRNATLGAMMERVRGTTND